MKLIFAVCSILLLNHLAFAEDSCEAWANENKLAGGAKAGFVKKCRRVTQNEASKLVCESQADEKNLKGSAKHKYVVECVDYVRANAVAASSKTKGKAGTKIVKAKPNARLKANVVTEKEKPGADSVAAKSEEKTKAAARTNVDATALYQQGLNQEEKGDNAAALNSFLIAANAGYGPAMKKLSQIYDKGNNAVSHDYQASIKWYDKAIQAGEKFNSIIKR